MIGERLEELRDEYRLGMDLTREPDLAFHTSWTQQLGNQAALLTASSRAVPDRSLCFSYAKQVPSCGESRRVLTGSGAL